MSNPWLGHSGIPAGASAVLAALHLADPDFAPISHLNSRGWRQALRFSDRAQLTLSLRRAARQEMPDWVRERTDGDAVKNAERIRIIAAILAAAVERFETAGIPPISLKGFAQSAAIDLDPGERMQYDVDLYCPPGRILDARDMLLEDGYEPLGGTEWFPTDHLPTLIRKTGWEWRGDFFDPDIPPSFELHFRFWDERTERLAAPGVEEFPERRTVIEAAGFRVPVLHAVDALGYAALHVLRHLLRGSLHAWHVYELALMLDRRAGDDGFWSNWRKWHCGELRLLESVSFELARAWFGCELPAEITPLPADSHAWIVSNFSSPVRGTYRPNKEELWLHLGLLTAWTDRCSVLRRRILPPRLPGPVDAVYLPSGCMRYRRRVLAAFRQARFAAKRAAHHVRALPGVVGGGMSWAARRNGLTPAYGRFMACAALFNFGLFIFFLLYNLYLIDLGLKASMLGEIASAGTLGSVLGTVPAALMARRLGLGRSLAICAVAAGALAGARAIAQSPQALLALSFASGLVFAVWPVCAAPAVAAAVEPRHRPAAFSLFFAAMIALGVAAGAVGGHLPAWAGGNRAALLIGSGVTALAVLPAMRLRALPVPAAGRNWYPRSAFVFRFLAIFAVWQLATGSFNPFFNAYFAHLGASARGIGLVFSGSQLAQVAAVLIAPVLMRRLGVPAAISVMMAGTACALGLLSSAGPATAAALYASYMAMQWMSEPGLNVLLMNGVAEGQRSGAAALATLVAFSMQAVAAFAAGRLIDRAGYRTLLMAAAALAAIAAAGLPRFIGHGAPAWQQPQPEPASVSGTLPK